ncbi:MAG: hypothetical protein JJ863_04430 [Deltaproteobacteria bacterium]|nr:hypothetical protein [Deltaproteobacteria bacterium]
MRTLHRTAAFAFLASAALGCGDPVPPTPFEGTVEIGTGETGFEPVADEQSVPLVFGPQGGHHVWISFRVTGFERQQVLMDLDVVPLSDQEPPPRASPVRLFMNDLGDDRWEYIGWPAQLIDAGCYVDVPLSFRMTLTDPDGNEVSDEVVLVPEGGAPGLEPCEM